MTLRKYYLLLLICLFVFQTLVFTSCDNSYDEEQRLTYYCCTEENDDLVDVIKKYNKYCLGNNKEKFKIDIIEFSSKDDMYTKMSTELMAGIGPDIVSLAQELPFEKMIDNEIFADINELVNHRYNDCNISFERCNPQIMNSGVFEGKRYFVPLFYCADIAFTSNERLKTYGIPTDFEYTYNNMSSDLYEYFNHFSDVPFSGTGYGKIFFVQFINSYVDLFNKTMNFESNEFSENLDVAIKIARNTNENYEDYVFVTPKQSFGGGSFIGVTSTMCYQYMEENDLKIVPNSRLSENIVSSYVQCAVAINSKSKCKDKALAFLEYALSEDIQKYWVGTSSVLGETLYSGSNSIALPVNNNAFIQTVEAASNYDLYLDIEGINVNETELTCYVNTIISDYVEIVNRINDCSIYNYDYIENTYYNSNVIGPIIDNYLDGKISKNKFIQQLISTTEIYLME